VAYQKGKTMKQAVRYNNREKQETIDDVLSLPFLAVPERGMCQEDAEYFGIRSSVSEADGKTITATYFPYYNKEGNLTGFKKRDWTVPKEDDFHFTVVGNIRISCQMFGQHVAKRGSKAIYIAEGEEEVVAIRRCIIDSLKGSQWEGKINPSVVGLSMGTANAQECVAHNEDFIRSAKEEVVLCLNNDHATPKETLKGIKKGKEATEDIAAFLLLDNMSTVKLPPNINDFREAYMKGHGKLMGKRLAFERETYSPEKIISGDSVSMEELLLPLQEGVKVDRFPRLMDKLHGFRHMPTGELTLYAAFSGVGKSTVCREVAWEIIRQTELSVGFIFLEETHVKTQQAMLALELGIPLNKFRRDPLACATMEAIEKAKNAVLSNGRTYFLDHFGSMNAEKLMNQIKYLHFICGCQHIVLDHISMVVSGQESNNERKDIDIIMTELASFVSANPCHIHVVSHLKRVEDPNLYKKKKDDEEPQPYWRELNIQLLRGSGGLEQMAFNIILVENEVMPDGTRGRVRLKLGKNREWSELGVCDVLIQKEDGRLHNAEDDCSF